jgi:hypothetical protein
LPSLPLTPRLVTATPATPFPTGEQNPDSRRDPAPSGLAALIFPLFHPLGASANSTVR